MHLGAFSISLAVKDLAVSRAFYEALGFNVFAGNPEENWLMLHQGDHVIGLFQGMFEENILTFNPGWNQQGQEVNPFDDVRTLAAQLKAHGIPLEGEAELSPEGPGYITLKDPDGNTILIDQHR